MDPRPLTCANIHRPPLAHCSDWSLLRDLPRPDRGFKTHQWSEEHSGGTEICDLEIKPATAAQEHVRGL